MTGARHLARWASLVAPAAAALSASSALLVDYARPTPVFCELGAGCDAVRQTALARPLGVPLPAIGVVAFLALGGLAALRGSWVRRAHAALGLAGGLAGLGLIAAQLAIGHVCVYCAIVDASAVALAVAAAARARAEWDPPEGKLALYGVPAALSASIALPAALSLALPPRVPPVIAAELARTPPGQVTVVDFVDFECPWCRKNHRALAPLLAERADKVRVVRKHVPLWIHPHALSAATAAVCAERQGKGDALAEALFEASPLDLDPAGCERLAERAGLALEPFRACVADPATLARIEADRADFKASGGRGLPTLWIGRARLDGASDPPTLRAALDRALR